MPGQETSNAEWPFSCEVDYRTSNLNGPTSDAWTAYDGRFLELEDIEQKVKRARRVRYGSRG